VRKVEVCGNCEDDVELVGRDVTFGSSKEAFVGRTVEFKGIKVRSCDIVVLLDSIEVVLTHGRFFQAIAEAKSISMSRSLKILNPCRDIDAVSLIGQSALNMETLGERANLLIGIADTLTVTKYYSISVRPGVARQW
jgi:hypothetical protein